MCNLRNGIGFRALRLLVSHSHFASDSAPDYRQNTMKSLAGNLLIASRHLADPKFFHTVVLIVRHAEDGALGLVLNRPLELTVKEACEDSPEIQVLVEDVLHKGGPCPGELMAIHAHPKAGEIEVFTGIFFSTEASELKWLLKQCSPTAKFFVGYSGWGPEQLENELQSGAWLVVPATTDLIFDRGEMWSKLVTWLTAGGQLDRNRIPDDPSVN
jgi:putative transcriptional regulator